MIVHTALWRLSEAALSCGHTMSVRTGETSTYCSWCTASVEVLPAAA